jgi:hypothetical protein
LRQIAVYLDNADEMTDVSDGPMWVNIQQGLALAIGKLRKGKVLRERNLTIFCSVRSEAILARSESQQISDLLLPLTYTESDLATMFKTCCRLTDEARLAFPDLREADPVRAFLGASIYEHSDRTDLSGERLREDALSAMIRHTRLVPRELIAIGKDIHDKIGAQQRRDGAIRAIREKVNAQAATNTDFFLNSCYPPWKGSVSELLPRVNASVLRRAELIDPGEPTMATRQLNAVQCLVAWGLLGCSEPSQASTYTLIQRFAFDPESVGAVQELAAKCDYFFVHTAFKEWLRSKGWVADWRESPEHLAGNELIFRTGRPIFTLSMSGSTPTISVRNGIDEYGLAVVRSCGSEQISCLFALLCAWKVKEAKGRISGDQLKAVKSVLRRDGQEMLIFQATDITKWEDLARKMRLCLRDWKVPMSATPLSVDGRRSPILSCHTTDGSRATFTLPGIDPGEIELDFDYASLKEKLRGLA